ncbi:MAG: hypothetical protein BroJett003_27620 [Planctomycetota bacterium]|nr:MAG: hypothetical protein BroJett003_27620 [Planctomycetota bacterium]
MDQLNALVSVAACSVLSIPLLAAKLTGNLAAAAAALGLTEEQVRKAVHAIKRALGIGGAFDVLIDTETGNVHINGEEVGNIFDALNGFVERDPHDGTHAEPSCVISTRYIKNEMFGHSYFDKPRNAA